MFLGTLFYNNIWEPILPHASLGLQDLLCGCQVREEWLTLSSSVLGTFQENGNKMGTFFGGLVPMGTKFPNGDPSGSTVQGVFAVVSGIT